MPMGNPLSPTIADIVLDSLLDYAIEELENKNIYLKYIVKYVDDVLAVINLDDKDAILNIFNSYHPKIKFTTEMEANNEISYLDMKLRREDNRIIFDWYTKDTSSGRIMNFNTTQPINQIINTAKNFIFRVLNISDSKYHAKNIKIITNILLNNSFPYKLINALINNTYKNLEFKNNSQPNTTATNEPMKFYSVRYIPGLTDSKNIRTAITTKNISFAYKPNTTLSTVFSTVKTPINKHQQSNVVYEVKCKGNDNHSCDLRYIGTTKRTLETRMGEHKMDIEKGRGSTALSMHILQSGHTADFTKIKILDKERIERKRYTIESLRIQQHIKTTMNLKEDTNNINASYRVAII